VTWRNRVGLTGFYDADARALFGHSYNGPTSGKGGKRGCAVSFHVSCGKRAYDEGYRVSLMSVSRAHCRFDDSCVALLAADTICRVLLGPSSLFCSYAPPIDPDETDGYSVAKVCWCPQHHKTEFDAAAWVKQKRLTAAEEEEAWEQLRKQNTKGKKRKAAATTKKPKSKKPSTATSASTLTSASRSHVKIKGRAPPSSADESDHNDDADEDSGEVRSAILPVVPPPSKKARTTRSGTTFGVEEEEDVSITSSVPSSPRHVAPSHDQSSASSEEKKYKYRQYCARIDAKERESPEQSPAAAASASSHVTPPRSVQAASLPDQDVPFGDLTTPMRPLTISSGSIVSPVIGVLPAMVTSTFSSPVVTPSRPPATAITNDEPLDTSWSSDVDPAVTGDHIGDTSDTTMRPPPLLTTISAISHSSQEFDMLAYIASDELSPRVDSRHQTPASGASGRRSAMNLSPSATASARPSLAGSEVAAYTDSSAGNSRRESLLQSHDGEKENLHLPSWFSNSSPRTPKGDVTTFLKAPISLHSIMTPIANHAADSGGVIDTTNNLEQPPSTDRNRTPPISRAEAPTTIGAAVHMDTDNGE
jgi:hypothetical protein